MKDVNGDVPKIVRQGEIVQEISSLIPARKDEKGPPDGWQKLVYITREITMYGESEAIATMPDGTEVSCLAPSEVSDLAEELRKVMYQVDVGTWFEARWTLSREPDGGYAVDISFNYDAEPEWAIRMRDGQYALDLEEFPRSSENIPDWLREKVAAAEREGERQRQKEEAREKHRRDQ